MLTSDNAQVYNPPHNPLHPMAQEMTAVVHQACAAACPYLRGPALLLATQKLKEIQHLSASHETAAPESRREASIASASAELIVANSSSTSVASAVRKNADPDTPEFRAVQKAKAEMLRVAQPRTSIGKCVFLYYFIF
jgi:hypothetical protein